MTTATARPVAQQSERVLYGKLWWAGPLAIAAATVTTLIGAAIFQALLRPNPGFLPLTLGPVAFFTVIFTLIGVGVYAAVGRFSRRPVSLYRRIALIALVVSCIPDLGLPFAPPEVFPGANWPNTIALLVLHVAAWAVFVPVLTRFAGEE